MKIAFLIVSFFLTFMSFSYAEMPGRQNERSWVDSLYQTMSDQQRVGQLINLKIDVKDKNIFYYSDLIRNYCIGQISIKGGHPEAFCTLIDSIKEFSKIPLLITSNGYRSIGLPIDSAFRFPGVESFSYIDDTALVNSIADEVVIQNSQCQVQVYHTGLLNIDISSFGMSMGGGFLNDYGSLPGWSDIFHQRILDNEFFINTDIRVFGVGSDGFMTDEFRAMSVLEEVNLKRKFGSNYVDKWMFTITHIPFFDNTEAEEVQKKLINGIIRKKLGSKGLIAVDLDALYLVHSWRKADQHAVSLLLAGVDVITVSRHPENIFRQLQKAISDGVIKPRELELKVKRVLKTKYLAGLDRPRKKNSDHLYERLNRPEAQLVSAKVFQKSVNVQNGRLCQIPIKELEGRYFASLSFGGKGQDDFQEMLGNYTDFVHFTLPSLSYDPGLTREIHNRLKTFDVVMIGLHFGDYVEVGQDIARFVNELSLQTKIILVFFKDIRNEADFSNRATKIFVHEDHPYVQSLAAQAIFGAFLPAGISDEISSVPYRLAYGIPEEEQMDSRTLHRIDRIARESIRERDMPGCQVLVARNGKVVFNSSFGHHTYDSLKRVDNNTIYDLASITKVAATTQVMMWLYEQGKIDIDKPVGYYLHELNETNKEDLIIRDILAHQAGLKPFYPFWRYTVDQDKPDFVYYHDSSQGPDDVEVVPGMYAGKSLRDSIWIWTVKMDLLPKNEFGGYDYQYSDLGFYILQRLVERVTEKQLDVLTDSLFYAPIGMPTMGYNPFCEFSRDQIAPAEHDTYFRQALIWGTVHDPVAAMAGGVAGHAGLFSNAGDLAKLMQMNLNMGTYGGRTYLKGSSIKEFTSIQNKNNRRSLGWDKPEQEKGYNPASRYASWQTYGHRGFTGTAVWADPTFQLIYVFLSNRVYKGSENIEPEDLNVRKRIHDVIYESMWNFEKIHKREP